MEDKCPLCNLKKQDNFKNVKIYFENDEIIIMDTDKSDRIMAMIKEHRKDIEDHNASGIIKLLIAILGKNYPGRFFTIEKKEEGDHWHIYAKINSLDV